MHFLFEHPPFIPKITHFLDENAPFNPKIMHFLLENHPFKGKSCIFSSKIPHLTKN
ncbi:hypothetical protein CP10743SC13_2173, partial [Chlamydia psittaci 10_743_SC13]